MTRKCTLDIPLGTGNRTVAILGELGVTFPTVTSPTGVQWDLSQLQGAHLACREKNNCQLKIPIKSRGGLDQVWAAEAELGKLGVSFDVGMDMVDSIRDWELDYSLDGGILDCQKTNELT